MEEATTRHFKKQHSMRSKFLFGVLVLVTSGAVGTSFMFYSKYQKAQEKGPAEQKRLIQQLSQTIDLPETTPAIVTVADKDRLSNKTLAERVKNKDMLLIYASTKRIVVYRPSTKKVIDMLTFASQAEVPSASGSTTNTSVSGAPPQAGNNSATP